MSGSGSSGEAAREAQTPALPCHDKHIGEGALRLGLNRECVAAGMYEWGEDGYHPSCCRFPKVCSPYDRCPEPDSPPSAGTEALPDEPTQEQRVARGIEPCARCGHVSAYHPEDRCLRQSYLDGHFSEPEECPCMEFIWPSAGTREEAPEGELHSAGCSCYVCDPRRTESGVTPEPGYCATCGCGPAAHLHGLTNAVMGRCRAHDDCRRFVAVAVPESSAAGTGPSDATDGPAGAEREAFRPSGEAPEARHSCGRALDSEGFCPYCEPPMAAASSPAAGTGPSSSDGLSQDIEPSSIVPTAAEALPEHLSHYGEVAEAYAALAAGDTPDAMPKIMERIAERMRAAGWTVSAPAASSAAASEEAAALDLAAIRQRHEDALGHEPGCHCCEVDPQAVWLSAWDVGPLLAEVERLRGAATRALALCAEVCDDAPDCADPECRALVAVAAALGVTGDGEGSTGDA